MYNLRRQMLRSFGDDTSKLGLIDVSGGDLHDTIIARPRGLSELARRKRRGSITQRLEVVMRRESGATPSVGRMAT